MAVKEGTYQTIAISQALFVKNKLGLAALAHTLRTGNVGHPAPDQDRLEGNLWTDIESV